MNLSGKTRAEIVAAMASKSRAELVELVVSLVAFDRLLTAREISEASHVSKRDVLADIRAGRFVDPLFGRGFFCWASHSLKVSAAAANAWRQSFFVPVAGRVVGITAPDGSEHLVPDPITGHKKREAAPEKRSCYCWALNRPHVCGFCEPPGETDLDGKNAPAKGRDLIRRASPGFLASNSSK